MVAISIEIQEVRRSQMSVEAKSGTVDLIQQYTRFILRVHTDIEAPACIFSK